MVEFNDAVSVEHRPFSQPWEESDVVLIVEEEKFHVHRLVLTLNSPVFKAMLKSDFKEAKRGEITLPEKDAHEVLDLLKQLYMHERDEISMDNVEHLLRLADEYQIKGILDMCSSFLKKEAKTETNAMKILLLAQQYDLNDKIREGCCHVLSQMKLQKLEGFEEFVELDAENLRRILIPRMKLLEGVVKELSPQVAGLISCTTWLWNEAKKEMAWCPAHIPNGRATASFRVCLRYCPACQEVLDSLVSKTQRGCGGYHRSRDQFNKNFSDVLKKLFDLED